MGARHLTLISINEQPIKSWKRPNLRLIKGGKQSQYLRLVVDNETGWSDIQESNKNRVVKFKIENKIRYRMLINSIFFAISISALVYFFENINLHYGTETTRCSIHEICPTIDM